MICQATYKLPPMAPVALSVDVEGFSWEQLRVIPSLLGMLNAGSPQLFRTNSGFCAFVLNHEKTAVGTKGPEDERNTVPNNVFLPKSAHQALLNTDIS